MWQRGARWLATCWGLLHHSALPSCSGKPMLCGEGVPLCGVLALESGLGLGVYHHTRPVVHGLWPETGAYGDSQCLRPSIDAGPPEVAAPCYLEASRSEQEALRFQEHEWKRHGLCAGVPDATGFFRQVCNLAEGPLRTLRAAREAQSSRGSGIGRRNEEMRGLAAALGAAGYPVWAVAEGTGSEVQIAACAGSDGQWKLANPTDFALVCRTDAATENGGAGGGAKVSIGPGKGGLVAEATEGASCPTNQHGPQCASDGECVGLARCVRCAHSGYCTRTPLSGFLAANVNHGSRRGQSS